MKAAAPICLVCGTEPGEVSVVACDICATPHHQECWEYWGRCAIYACEGMKRTAGAGQLSLRAETEIVAHEGTLPALEPAVGDVLDPFVSKALMRYTAEGAQIALAPGEQAVELPLDVMPQLMDELYGSRDNWLVFALCAGTILCIFSLAFPFAWLAIPPVVALAAFLSRWRQAARAWLVRQGDGRLAYEVARRRGAGLIHQRTPFDASPRRIELVRDWDATPDDLLLALHCRLAVVWDDDRQMIVSPSIRMPRANQPRGGFLAQLVRLRAVGQQMADLLRLPYHERFIRPGA